MGIDVPVWASAIMVMGALLLLIGAGMWISIALIGAGLFALAFLAGGKQDLIDSLLFNGLNSFVLVAIPMFIFMGELILKSGLSEGLYRGVSKWTAVIPGSLLHSNIVACSIFAAVSGSSAATAATVGTVAYRDQRARGYHYGLLGGSVAAGGTLGILIPPSIPMIVYGDFVGASVAKLFAGGVIPGVMLTLLFIIAIAVIALIRPRYAPERREQFSLAYLRNVVTSFKDIWPLLVIILVIFGGIYGGFMTPSEAAAVSCFAALLLALFLRKLDINVFKEAAFAALRTTAMVLLIVVAAKILGAGIALTRMPAELVSFVSALGLSKMWVWAVIVLLYLILGCFMEGLSMMLLTLPVTYELLVRGLGFDPIWFGVVLVVLIECALITPPVGVNLFIIHGISRDESFSHLTLGAFPFFIIMIGMVGLLTAFPFLVTWLPGVIMPAR
ncbi:MAG: TRAP transporter large permease subunit [Chloroflexi bacterium]|nr:TRAP transporter large permease subunit [Chloroflexota bacterium]